MFRTKLLPAGLLASVMAASISPGGRCSPGSDRPAPPGPRNVPEWKLDDLRWDPAISGKLSEIEELKQKVEQIRKLVVPKVFEKHSKPYREKIEALQKEVDEYVRSVNQAAGGAGLSNSAELLTPQRFAKLRAAIRPQGNEWRHLQVHWYTDIIAARKKAAAEDKPILVFRTTGAGYNDPLGQC